MNEEQTQKIIDKVMFKSNGEFDASLIRDCTDEMGYKILSYCTRNDIPLALELVWVRMVIDLLESTGKQFIGANGVSEIAEGDMKVKYSTAKTSEESLINSVVLNYKIDLNRFRQLKGLGR